MKNYGNAQSWMGLRGAADDWRNDQAVAVHAYATTDVHFQHMYEMSVLTFYRPM